MTRIVRLGPGDTTLARGLNAMFGDAFADPGSFESARPDDAYLTGLLSKDHVFALAALEGETVIGGLVAYQLDKFEQARSEIYLYDLAVAEPYRRRGFATALIGHLQVIARDRGAWVIFVQGDYGDHPALSLYRKLGTQEKVLHFDIPPALA